jgi:hypothetical protein
VNSGTSPNSQGNRTKQKEKDDPISIETIKPLDVRADIPKDWRDKLNWALTAALVLIGIGGIVFAVRTVLAIEDQGKRMKEQVDLMKRQADLMQASQRAWVLVDNIGEPILYEDIERPEIMSAMAGTPFLVFNLKTVGTTTAKLIGTGARFHLVPRKNGAQPEPALRDEPEYKIGSGTLPQAGFVKAPNEGFQIAIPLEDGPVSRDHFAATNEKQLFPCAYGFVTYEDSFGQPHETRFCYIYRVSYRVMISQETGKNVFPSKFELGGPEAYHRYT